MPRAKKIKLEHIRTGLSDTLIKIAIKYEVSIDDLRQLNPDIISNSERLMPGRKVRIK